MTEPLLRVEGLTKHFPVTRGVLGRVVGQVRAVDDVSFHIAAGETLGLVGESGCGKTTVGRCVLRLADATAGRITFDGADVTNASQSELVRLRRDLQVVFQDPFSSLNPRLRVVDIVGEALEVHGIASGAAVETRVAELLARVGLSPSWINRYPHEFSGGQRQRIGVARAIALGPKLVVCDEAVSALDVSIQAQVVNLLIQLRREMNLAYLFIAHDLSVVRHVSHRIAVMYLGQLVELGASRRLFEAPAHPYTRALLSAIPIAAPRRVPRRIVLHGDVPTPLNPPSGCRFHTRCPAVMDRCRTEEPRLYEVEREHPVKCLHAEGLEGDPNWYPRISERIERRMAENAAQRPVEQPASEPSPPPPERRAAEGIVEEPPRFSKRRVTAVLLLLFAIIVLVAVALDRFERRRAARGQIERLSGEIVQYARLTGAPPASLRELGWRLYPIFERGVPEDPWGRPLRYRVPGVEGRAYDLGSTGPDGVPSGDDVGIVPSQPPGNGAAQ